MSKITSDIDNIECILCCHKNESSISCLCKCHKQTRVLATNLKDSALVERIRNE